MDARETRFGPDELAAVFADAKRVVAARGKKVVEFDLTDGIADPEELAKRVLGPSGNLRAPVARRGKTFVVGYSDAAWDSVFEA